MQEIPIYTIDAFASKPFTGNSAAICLVGCSPLDENTMQKMASEMNISETAFVELLNNENDYKTSDKFKLRWFTPTNEVALCGHATLAAASVIFFKSENRNNAITFSTLSGDLHCRRDGGKRVFSCITIVFFKQYISEYITLDLPLNEPRYVTESEIKKYDLKNLFAIILGKTFEDYIKDIAISCTLKKLVIQLKDDQTREFLESLTLDTDKMLASHNGSFYKGVIVTVKAGDEKDYDFYSRYFAPWNGINEDPVTGSAHTVLAPYWGKILEKTTMFARQCSKRGGDLKVSIRNDERVDVAGNAVVVITGTIAV